MNHKKSLKKRLVLANVALLTALAFSGCMGIGGDEAAAENQTPEAKLTVNKESAFNGESFRFSGVDSKDPDGTITSWRFDFGDGTFVEIHDTDDEPQVEHAYAQGGEYTATLTVTDNGGDNAGKEADTDEARINVNERQPVESTVVYTMPPPTGSPDGTDRTNQTFEAKEGADRFELELDIQSLLPAGSSEVQINVLDQDGGTIAERQESIAAGQNRTVELANDLPEEGKYQIEIIAESGAAEISGENRVYYG